MSAATEEAQVVGTGLALLPRVNLLPPEIGERRRFRQIQYGMGAGVLAAVGVVALLLLAAGHGAASAQSEVDAADSRHTSLQADSVKYADVTAVYAQAAAAQATLTLAMGQEVRYSQLLNDLSMSVPDKVWVKSLTFSQAPPVATPGLVAADPGVGTLTVAGIGFSHDDVALWLDSLATQKNYTNPDFTSSTEALVGKRKVVNFASTASLTSVALSGRYTKPAGG